MKKAMSFQSHAEGPLLFLFVHTNTSARYRRRVFLESGYNSTFPPDLSGYNPQHCLKSVGVTFQTDHIEGPILRREFLLCSCCSRNAGRNLRHCAAGESVPVASEARLGRTNVTVSAAQAAQKRCATAPHVCRIVNLVPWADLPNGLSRSSVGSADASEDGFSDC